MSKILARSVLAAALVGAAVSAFALDISGAGATFPYPVYSKWADTYKKETGNGLNYQSIGSGGGIKQIIANTVTFGATDAPLKPEDLEKNGLVQWPQVMGGIVPVINLDGVAAGNLVIDGPALAKIFLGEIKTWNDPALVKLNPSLKLPASPIAVVHRSDGSGTSFNFTDYLSKVSADWKSKVGAAAAVEWPLGLGAKGNEGVANTVANTKGAIGYVEYAYAKQNKMNFAKMVNHDGKTVAPDDHVLPGRRRQRRLGPCAWLLPDPDRPEGRRLLADHRRDLHPGAQAAHGCRRDVGSAEVLLLGVQEWRQGRRSARLYPHARQRRRHDQEDMGQGNHHHRRQAGLRRQIRPQ